MRRHWTRNVWLILVWKEGEGERGIRLGPTTKCRGYPTLGGLWPFWGKGREVGRGERGISRSAHSLALLPAVLEIRKSKLFLSLRSSSAEPVGFVSLCNTKRP
jgi:hypothetical protein